MASNPVARLEQLLVAWRTYRGAELAALVHRASQVASRGREAITGTNPAELQKSWLAVENKHDPIDVDRLLAALTEGRCEHAIERLKRIARWPHDPRIVEKLVSICEADPRLRRGESSPVPFTSQPNRPFWNQLLILVEERGDATIVERLRAVTRRTTRSTFEDWLATRLTKLVPELVEREATPPSAATRKQLAAVVKQLERDEAEARPAAETGDALYEAVWAAPDDDAPRLVLADFLTERGDPRGELISLQLARHAGTLDAAGKKREKELLKRHKKQWLGPIAPLIQPYRLRFERGFLVTCQLEPNAELEKTLGNHPAWSTIREYLVHDYAKTTAKNLVAMLNAHGATAIEKDFTRGIE